MDDSTHDDSKNIKVYDQNMIEESKNYSMNSEVIDISCMSDAEIEDFKDIIQKAEDIILSVYFSNKIPHFRKQNKVRNCILIVIILVVTKYI